MHCSGWQRGFRHPGSIVTSFSDGRMSWGPGNVKRCLASLVSLTRRGYSTDISNPPGWW